MNSPWTRRKSLLVALATFHLAIVSLGMTDVTRHLSPAALRVFMLYEHVTGAGGGFGFFSPEVGQQLILRFEVKDGGEIHRDLALETFVQPEVAIRIGNMARMMATSFENEKVRRAVAASLAIRVFARYPNADEVTLVGTAFQFPSLDEYRIGQRARRTEVYRVKFRLRPSTTQNDS